MDVTSLRKEPDGASTAPHVGTWLRVLSGRVAREPLLTLVGAALVFGGFFLPWMDGSGPFALRTFSGFDFARLVRNFEITSESTQATAEVRGAAIVMYLIPAAAVNAAVLNLSTSLTGLPPRIVAWAVVACAAYILVVLSLLLVLSLFPLNDFESAVGLPTWGFGVTLGGALLMGWVGRRKLRQAGG